MTFIKRLFGHEKQAAEPMHGAIPSHQANDDRVAQAAARKQMEAEVTSDRERRGATDERPVDSTR